MLRLEIAGRRGWTRYRHDGVTLWFTGHLHNRTPEAVAQYLSTGVPAQPELAAWLKGLDGHFAFVAEGPHWVLAAVDRVRSSPLLVARTTEGWLLGPDGPELVRRLGGDRAEVNHDAALTLGMAGYTLGESTLYRRLTQLRPGEYLFAREGKMEHVRYDAYRSWAVTPASRSILRTRLTEVTLGVLRKLIDSADGRPIVVPLSAGLDSRLVVSGLVHLGCRNVRCFAYGQPGNFEADASRRIAEHLGLAWTFIPSTQARQRHVFVSRLYHEYLAYADCCASVPFQQDFLAIRDLSESGWIPPEAVLVNGNSGDFISGGHVPAILHSPWQGNESERLERVFQALVAKHFSLWASLKTPEHIEVVRRQLMTEWESIEAAPGSPDTDHGLYEFIECQERQCKYVITGQRVYEFFGYAWRLPLWDGDYLDFWQGVPLEYKANQNLYKEMLEQENWGGVWRGWHVRRYVTPRWIAASRPMLKPFFALQTRARWHEFDRQYLKYWMDVLCNYAVAPYSKVATDRRGFRNAIAWHTERYLASKGLSLDGQLLQDRLSAPQHP